MFKKGDIIKVEIENLVFNGPGVVKLDQEGKKISLLIEGVVPGDEVEAKIFYLRKNKAKARVKKFIKLSPQRIKPRCPHFGSPIDENGDFLEDIERKFNCGGCSWQFLDYDDQLQVKYAQIANALENVNLSDKLIKTCLKPVLGMFDPWFYRNKMEFSFCRNPETKKFTIGLHKKGRFYEVTEIEQCFIFKPWIGELLKEIRLWLNELEIKDELKLNSLVVRVGTNSHEILLNLIVENGEIKFEEQWTKRMLSFFAHDKTASDHLVSLYLSQIINKKGQRKEYLEKLVWGKPVFQEILRLANEDNMQLEIHPDAFLQPNTLQAQVFYSLIVDLADLKGKGTVFDLFCGTGTIGLCLASKAKQIIGIESNKKAILDAQRNAQLNEIKNTEFLVGDVNKLLPELGKEADLIVVDPPRAGLSEKIIETIANTSCKKLIYVSCNPLSLATDLKLLLNKGFNLKLIQPIDQFCHTYHVETICLLIRNI